MAFGFARFARNGVIKMTELSAAHQLWIDELAQELLPVVLDTPPKMLRSKVDAFQERHAVSTGTMWRVFSRSRDGRRAQDRRVVANGWRREQGRHCAGNEPKEKQIRECSHTPRLQ